MTGNGMAGRRPKSGSLLFAGANQPARRPFGITDAGEGRLPVLTRDVAKTPFYRLVEFTAPDASSQSAILIVAPLSGHFAVLSRDLILGLLPYFRVYVTDWINVRHVPGRYGGFGLGRNISSVLDMIGKLAPGLHVLGLCQGGVPALAAAAILAGQGDTRVPASLILMGSPIDPLANPTRVVRLLRSRPLSWFEKTVIARVPDEYAGRGRLVYPAHLHSLPIWTYLARHASEGSDTGARLFFDDGGSPEQFPFLDLVTSLMDLDAQFFLENTRDVFHECLLRQGVLRFEGERVDPASLRATALLTIEGERDDIAALGQTSAAHALCSSIPARMHRSLTVPNAGHFSLFYGETWRREVLPVIRAFCKASQRAQAAPSRSLARI